MDEQLKAALEKLNTLKAELEKGMVSKESYDNQIGKVIADIEVLKNNFKEMDEHYRKRATVMDGLKEKEFSMGKLMCGILLDSWAGKSGTFGKREDCAEYNIVKEYMNLIGKDAHSTTGGQGGYAIPPQAIQTWIDKLYAKLVLSQAGITLLTGLKGVPVTIPRLSGSTNGYWVGEGTAITESRITDQQVSLTPKKVAALVTLNNELLRLSASNPSVEKLIMNDMEKILKLKIDLAGLRGSGSEYQPRGIANVANILPFALGVDGDYFTTDSVIDMEGLLDDANALDGNLAFITHGKVKRRMRKQKIAQYSGDTGGEYVLKAMSDQALKDFVGHETLTTGLIPTNLTKGNGTALSEVYFGNWADLVLGQWGGLDLAASESAGNAFENDQTKMRMIQSVDFAVRHPESFAFCNDAKTV